MNGALIGDSAKFCALCEALFARGDRQQLPFVYKQGAHALERFPDSPILALNARALIPSPLLNAAAAQSTSPGLAS